LFIGSLAYIIMRLNSIYLDSSVIGLIAFIIYIMALGEWVGNVYCGCRSLVNFLLGCFTVTSLIIVSMGVVVYLMIFSALAVWIFLACLLLVCYFFDAFSKVERVNGNNCKNAFFIKHAFECLRVKRIALVKTAFLIVTVISGLSIAVIARTGDGIGHIGQAVSPIFWLILVFSFVIIYLISEKKELTTGLELCLTFFVAFLVFGSPVLIYRHHITEDSFHMLGVIRSVIETGMYGWVPSTFKTGYFALVSLITVSSSAELRLSWIYKLLTPLLVSIYVPLFIYLILKRINRNEPQPFVVLISLMFFPTTVFLSIPLEKNMATVFFLGTFYFSLLILDTKKPRNADIMILSLALLATAFLHDYFAIYSTIPLLLSLFLRLFPPNKGKGSMFLLLIMLCFTSLLIPSSFVLASYLTGRLATTFSVPTINSIVGFWMPPFKLFESYSVEKLSYLYSNNFIWMRYVILTLGILTMIKSSIPLKSRKIRIWLIMTVLAFLLGYFLLKTATLNPPEAAKDYRFGFFVDMSLIPLAGIVVGNMMEKMRRIKIRFKLPSSTNERPNVSFKLSSMLMISLILIASFSIYSGYCFDCIMERPIKAEDYGRYVVTDEKMELMGYIKQMSYLKKSVILSDNHMAKIAVGALDIRLEKADLFHLNSGGELYSYFNEMKRNPNTRIMEVLMEKTRSDIGFFVIGLNDWKGWQSEQRYWIDEGAIERLKLLADDWQVFGKKRDLFVFVFEKHS